MIKNKLSKAIVIFNLVITPLVFVPNQIAFDYFYFPKYIVLMISCLLLLIPVWINRQNIRQILVWDTVNKILTAYIVYLCISVFFAKDPALAINGSYWRQEGLSTILFYVMLFLAARSIGNLEKKFYVAIIVSAVIISVYGTAQYFGFDYVQREYFRDPNVPISTIGNQNFIGSYMVLILPLVMTFWINDSRKISLVAYSIILFGLLATMSRGPWIGFAVSFVVYILLDSRINKRLLLSKCNLSLFVTTLSVILIFVLVSDISLIQRFLSIFIDFKNVIRNETGSDSAGTNRLFIWRRTWMLITERPWFGYGIENLGVIFPERFANDMIRFLGGVKLIDKAHNEYLDQMVSSGIPSLLIYLGFLFTILKNSFANLKDDPIKIALISSIIGYLVQAFFNIRVVSVAYVFWIFLALILNSSLNHSNKTTT